jgi:hypothetical protein
LNKYATEPISSDNASSNSCKRIFYLSFEVCFSYSSVYIEAEDMKFKLSKSCAESGEKSRNLAHRTDEKSDYDDIAATDYVETEELKKIQRATYMTNNKKFDMFDMFTDEEEIRPSDSKADVGSSIQVNKIPYTSTLVDNWDDPEGYYREIYIRLN